MPETVPNRVTSTTVANRSQDIESQGKRTKTVIELTGVGITKNINLKGGVRRV